ncbi:receptor-type tyrosine-protein phosphatase beta-like [Bufo gargarizans]|uniref:receptor-type tyrosine-protein phosphatase beta-like n=1 Tax=Bufo gargarizans TaxID=30331 RepID=UPI001CF5C327|nr:receptor-type tyrosine-protein phosphatase beta-like [Bufo gargarizans]
MSYDINRSSNLLSLSVATNKANPSVIQNLQVIEVLTSSATVQWRQPTGGPASYSVTVSGSPSSVYSLSSSTTSLTLSNLVPGNFYIVMVTANYVPVTIYFYTEPDIVKKLTIVNVNTTSVSLNWLPPDGSASSYKIEILQNSTLNTIVTSTSVAVGNLIPGKCYTFLVSSLVGLNTVKGESLNIFACTGPDIVKNLTVVNVNTTSVSLNWLPPDGSASSYKIEILQNSTLNTNVTSTSVTVGSLIPGKYYTFLVSSLVGENIVKGENLIISTYTRPDIVKNLTIVNVNTTSVSLNWLPPDGSASSYMIEILENSTLNTIVTSPSVTVGNLIPGKYYTFLVSSLVGENTVKGESLNISTYTRPDIVKNLTIVNVNTISVSLNWLPPDGSASSYMIEILENSTLNTIVTSPSVTVGNLIPGKYYTFLVSSLVGENTVKGESLNISTYTRPDIVKNLTIVNVNTTSVSLNWLPPDGSASSYMIEILENSTLNTIVTSPSVTVGNLIPGKYYTFLVSSLVGENTVKGESLNISTYTRPDIVKNLTIVNVNTTSVSLNWLPPDGSASSYMIEILENSTLNTIVTSPSVTVGNLIPGKYYTFLVSSLVGENTVKGESLNISTYTRPDIVKNLTIVNVNTTSVSLNWLPPDGSASSYMIEILENSTLNTIVTSPSVTVGNLIPGKYYTFLVSSLVGENTVKGESLNISTYTRPDIVKNLTIVNVNTTSVSLNWLPPDGSASSYMIEILENSTLNTIVTSPSVTVGNLIPGKYYTFLVSSLVGENTVKGESLNISTYTRPDIVKNLTIVNVNTTSVSLNWLPPDGSASSYMIEILENSTLNTIVTSPSVTVGNLIPGKYYTFLVSSLVGENTVKGESLNISTYTRPDIVKNLTIVNVNTTSVSLNWLPPDGSASSYMIEILENSTLNTIVTSPSVTVGNLIPGKYYTFLVSSLVGENTVKGESLNISTYTRPDIVKNLTIVNVNTTSVSLNWLPPDGSASSYMIEILENSTLNTIVTSPSVTVGNLIPGKYYTFLVSSLVGENTVKGESLNISTYTRPDIVKNLTIVNVNTTSVSLNWLPPDGSASSYMIEILENSTLNTIVTSPSVTVGNLIPGKYYTFLVSSLVGENTVKGESLNISTYTRPDIVKNLTIVNVNTTSVSLNWLPPDGSASSYMIEILENSTLNTIVTSPSVTVGNLIPGKYYTFLVSSLVGENTVKGESLNISTYTNAYSLFISLTYSSSDVNHKLLILKEINQILQKQFPDRNVTAALK